MSSVDEALNFMINILEKQVYPKLTGEGPYDWKDGKTDSAKANWEIIISAIKKEYYENNEILSQKSNLKAKFDKVQGSTGFKNFFRFLKKYPDETQAEQFLDRLDIENEYRKKFGKQKIPYPDNIKEGDDDAKIDWLRREIDKYTKINVFLTSLKFTTPWSKYRWSKYKKYSNMQDLVRDMDYDETKILEHMDLANAKDQYQKSFSHEYANPNSKTDSDQIAEIDSLINKLTSWKQGNLELELEKYNSRNNSRKTIQDIVLDSEKTKESYENYLLKYEVENTIGDIESITGKKYDGLRNITKENLETLKKKYEYELENNNNFDNDEMKQIIEDYQKVFKVPITVKEIRDKYPKYKDALYAFRNMILKQQFIDEYGYTEQELALLKKETDEQTHISLTREKQKVDDDFQKLRWNLQAANNFFNYKKETKQNIDWKDIYQKFHHNSEEVIFFLTWFQYNKRNIDDSTKKKSMKEKLAQYNDEYDRGIYNMQQDIDLYDRRKALFEKEIGKQMKAANLTYDELMKYQELKSTDIDKDLEVAKAYFDNRSDEKIYLDYLQELGDKDYSYQNMNANQKREYFKKKIKEIEKYKDKLTSDRFNELFGIYQNNHPAENVSTWSERYIWSKNLNDPIDLKKTETKLELDNLIHEYEKNYPDRPWTENENSSKNEESQIKYLKKVNKGKTNYDQNDDLQKAIQEWNDAFPTSKVNLPQIISQWNDDTVGARYYLLRTARIAEAKKLLGNRFNENKYPEGEEGLKLLLSDITFEKTKRDKFEKGEGTFKKALENYNKYFKSEGAERDMTWVKNEFDNSERKAFYGLQIYIFIDEINQFWEEIKYNRYFKCLQKFLKSAKSSKTSKIGD